jgi:bifunctional non-homologous end joining protein LigD
MTSKPPCSLNTNYNFSNLKKIYWNKTKLHPLITKKDLIEYYDKISSFILPHLRDRPLSLNRYPDGIGGKSFYHKNWQNEKPDYVQTIKIYSESKGENINYILCNNKETLLWLVNLGCIEMHPWYSKAKNYNLNDKISGWKVDEYGLNYPDFIVFDLDPYIYSGNEDKHQEPEYNLKAFKATVEIAYYLKDIFDKIKVYSFIKTSGKTGLHIFIPILSNYTYEQTKSFAQIIGRFLNKRLPDKITTEWNTSRRKDLVFFDYNQNARGKTIASVFSPRPTESATVSMPIEWKNLSNILPTDFIITNTLEILQIKKDPWKNIFDQKQDLVKILNNVSELSI